MAGESGTSLFASIPIPGLVAVITALTGTLLLHYEPLVPRRPVEPPNNTIGAVDSTKIEASLYDDPIAVMGRTTLVPKPDKAHQDPANSKGIIVIGSATITQAESATSKPGPDTAKPVLLLSPDDLSKEISKQLPGDGKPGKVLVLPVFLRPGTDMVSSEYRRRIRSAVIAGLASCGYPPVSGKLACCRFDSSQFQKEDTGVPVPFDVPVEWFRYSGSMPALATSFYDGIPPANVLVLWLRNDAMADTPLAKLRRLLGKMIYPYLPKDSISVWTMGPDATQGLADLAKESRDGTPDQDPAGCRWEGTINVLSHSATASNDDVSSTAFPEEQKPVDVKCIIGKWLGPGAVFERTILTDDLVAQALVGELKLRGLNLQKESSTPDPKNSNSLSHVAIISEFDSPYGRALPGAFLKASQEGAKATPAPRFNDGTSPWHWFSYPRGLDGRTYVGAATAPSSGNDKSPSGATSGRDYKPDEVPDGTSQADALRRLADHLEELQAKLIQKKGPGIRAIGLMGGDVYDKLWILRALRPRFPDVIFFTDNLDAWLWQREELRTTRNLIIASPYGLSLGDRLQMGKPPFRDSYQTSAYATTLTILGAIEPGIFACPSKDNIRRYEIGVNGPVDLSTTPTDKWRDLCPDNPQIYIWWSHSKIITLWLLVGSASIGALVWWIVVISPTRKELARANDGRTPMTAFRKPYTLLWLPLICLFSATVTCFLWKYQPDRANGLAEPLLLFSGVSVWSAECIRIVAMLLTIHLVIKIIMLLDENTRSIEKEYPLQILGTSTDVGDSSAGAHDPPPAARPTGRAYWDRPWLQRLFRSLNWIRKTLLWDTSATQKDQTVTSVNPQVLWSEYKTHTSLGARLFRSTCATFLLACFSCLLCRFFATPTSPARGSFARILDTSLDVASALAFLLITCFVTDALGTGRMFTFWFSRKVSSWPDTCIENYVKVGLDKSPACDLLDLQLVANRTRELGAITFYPFYILALLIVARCHRFDCWTWSPALIATYGMGVCLVVLNSWLLRKQVEDMRTAAIKYMQGLLPPLDKVDETPTGKLISIVSQLRMGAFAPLSEQPVMKAIYWLLGGLGVSGLLQYLSRFM